MEEKQYKWMVCTRCVTFNQAPYIEDAMNGFTMQQTTFPFVCTIIDDASTDGEPQVIRQYLQEHFDLEDKSVVRNEETDDYVLLELKAICNSPFTIHQSPTKKILHLGGRGPIKHYLTTHSSNGDSDGGNSGGVGCASS